ncbi:SdiA-regulated domain-containing protein [Pontibacter sp. H249]|uniref:SdiA-regulated domain-containing protein n=1 Tax=Pontibacter sp. H249 TaxID=3133420 RepID=UPI0030BC4144
MKKYIAICSFLLVSSVSLGACDSYSSNRSTFNPDSASTDKLTGAIAQWELPEELREVSGIALLEQNLMACVQDEEGAIYLYDLEQKKVTEKIAFAGPGDYEGIALNGNTAYILRSDGAIFEVENFRDSKPTVNKYTSGLASSQNTEGLAFDSKNNRLLIACKGYDQKLGDTKAIFAFSLGDKKMQESPVISIPLAQANLQAGTKKKKDKYAVLQPSSLEIHPVSGDLYMLDAVNESIMLVSEQGEIKRVVALDKKVFRQAEGLSFSSSGEMYIASEGGKKGRGVIVKYAKGI